MWEDNLFGQAYKHSSPVDRCKYGLLNTTRDPAGVPAAVQYGTSYFLLRGVRLRTTFAPKDSGAGHIGLLGTLDCYAHVLEMYSDLDLRATLEAAVGGVASARVADYKEVQIHGAVRLCDHVERIVAHPSLRDSRDHLSMLKRLAARCRAPVEWIGGGAGPPLGGR